MNDTIITVIVVVVLIIVMSFFSLKSKNDSWEGTLVKKKAIENEDSMVTVYKLTFKTDDGKTKHVTVNKTNPEVFFENVRYKKEKGEYIPKAVASEKLKRNI